MIVSIPEAAQRLNVSVDSIRRRVRTGLLPANRDERGQWWLDLSDDAPPAAPDGDRMGAGVGTPLQRTARDSLVHALEDQVDDLKARLDRSEAERREDTARFGAERDRLLVMIERLVAGNAQ